MRKKLAIIGAGGFGRETLDIFETCNQIEPEYEVLGFVVQAQYGDPGTMVNNKPILGGFDWLEKHKDQVDVICAVSAPQHRRRLVLKAMDLGCRFCSVIHPSVVMTPWISIGTGVIITAGCILTNQIQIANHVHINLGCTIGHNAILKDFVTLAPGVHISGDVTLSEGSFIGTGANIVEKLNIGAWSIVGAGSTLINDVHPNTTVVGVPARVVKTHPPNWYQQPHPDKG